MNFNDLENIFTQNISPNIKMFEQKRKAIFIKLNISWIIFIILSPFILIVTTDYSERILLLTILFVSHLIFRAFYKIYKLDIDQFYLDLKIVIIENLIKTINFNANYKFDKHIGSTVFKKSRITDGKISSTKGHDLISFESNNIKLYFSFIKSYEKSSIGSDGITHYGGPRIHNFTKFSGAMVYIPTNAENIFNQLEIKLPTWKVKSNKYGIFAYKRNIRAPFRPFIYRNLTKFNLYKNELFLLSEVLGINFNNVENNDK